MGFCLLVWGGVVIDGLAAWSWCIGGRKRGRAGGEEEIFDGGRGK